MMGHMVEAFGAARAPRETFEDGLVVNAILDAAYRSMRSGLLGAVGSCLRRWPGD